MKTGPVWAGKTQRSDYLKNAVCIIIAQRVLWRVHDPIVSDVFSADAVLMVFVHWDTKEGTLDSLSWQQIVDLCIGGEQRAGPGGKMQRLTIKPVRHSRSLYMRTLLWKHKGILKTCLRRNCSCPLLRPVKCLISGKAQKT